MRQPTQRPLGGAADDRARVGERVDTVLGLGVREADAESPADVSDYIDALGDAYLENRAFREAVDAAGKLRDFAEALTHLVEEAGLILARIIEQEGHSKTRELQAAELRDSLAKVAARLTPLPDAKDLRRAAAHDRYRRLVCSLKSEQSRLRGLPSGSAVQELRRIACGANFGADRPCSKHSWEELTAYLIDPAYSGRAGMRSKQAPFRETDHPATYVAACIAAGEVSLEPSSFTRHLVHGTVT